VANQPNGGELFAGVMLGGMLGLGVGLAIAEQRQRETKDRERLATLEKERNELADTVAALAELGPGRELVEAEMRNQRQRRLEATYGPPRPMPVVIVQSAEIATEAPLRGDLAAVAD
jgi:hypothetical protein